MRSEILLLYPPGLSYTTPPLSLAYLAAVLRRDSLSVHILDASVEELSLSQTMSRIKSIQPRIIGISARSPDYNMIERLAWLIKDQLPSTSIVLGGSHPTIAPENVLNCSPVDYVVRGEGEYTFLELCKFLLKRDDASLSNIRGISYREKGKIIHNLNRPFIDNLDELPLPARDLLPIDRYRNYGQVVKRIPVAAMITSRGCPYNCIFCSNNVFGREYRFHSPNKVIEEIKYLKQVYGIKEINFMENNFTANPARVEAICDMIISEGLDISWICQSHVNTVDKHMLKQMRRAGCWFIHFGVESGDYRILKVLKKGINLEKAVQVFRQAQEEGIRTLAYFMVGNYDDTHETVKNTIDFSLKLDTDFVAISITTPFPGTELFSLAKKQGLIVNESYDYLNSQKTSVGTGKCILRTKQLNSTTLEEYQRIAIRRFYLRPRQILTILSRIRSRYQIAALWDLARAFMGVNPKSYDNRQDVKQEIYQEYCLLEKAKRLNQKDST